MRISHLAHAHEALSHAPRARTGFDSPAGSSTPATHQQHAPNLLLPPTLACHLALFLWLPLLPSLPSPSLHLPIHVQHHTPAARGSTPRPAHPDQQNAPSLLLPLTLACHLAPTASPPHHTGSSTIPNDTSSFQLLPAFLFLLFVWFGLKAHPTPLQTTPERALSHTASGRAARTSSGQWRAQYRPAHAASHGIARR